MITSEAVDMTRQPTPARGSLHWNLNRIFFLASARLATSEKVTMTLALPEGRSAQPGVTAQQVLRVYAAGMDATQTLHWNDTDVEVHKVVVGPYENNVFVVRCRHSGEAVLLDAANEHELLLDLARSLGVRTILETHGHWDHIQAIPQVRDAGFEVGVTAADAEMLPSYDYILEDDSMIEFGTQKLHTAITPGHTPGSICFKLVGKPLLFTGDTLFPGGPGATAKTGSDFNTIIDSIDTRLFTYDPDTIVLPGHGDNTTIGAERPSLQEWVDRGW